MDLFFSEFPHRQIDDLHRMLHDYDDNVGRMVFDNPEDYSFVIQILASYVIFIVLSSISNFPPVFV